jgi:hypothetical protein
VKWALRAVGALIAFMGIVWIGQGLGFLPGSFMTGQIAWAWRGLLAAAIGFGLVYASSRIGRPRG